MQHGFGFTTIANDDLVIKCIGVVKMKNQDVQLSFMKDDWLAVSHMFLSKLYLGFRMMIPNDAFIVQMIRLYLALIFTIKSTQNRACC